MRYFECRSERIEKQNAQSEANSTTPKKSVRDMTQSEIDRRALEAKRRKQEYEERIKPENAQPISQILGAFGGGWMG